MFTPELKDQVLKALTEHQLTKFSFNPRELAFELELDLDQLIALLEYFERKGLISDLTFGLGANYCSLTLRVEAFDLVRMGGFTALEQTFELELQKLQKEAETIKKTFPDKAERMLSTLSNLLSLVEFFKP